MEELLAAIEAGDLKKVQELLNLDNFYRNIYKNKNPLMDLLLKHTWLRHNNPLSIAAKGGHLGIVKEFLKIDAIKKQVSLFASDMGLEEALEEAAGSGHLDIVKELLQVVKLKLEKSTFLIDRILERAIEGDHIEIVRELLQIDAVKIRVACNNGMRIIAKGGPQIAEYGHFALRTAGETGSLEILIMLLQVYQSLGVPHPLDITLRLKRESPEKSLVLEGSLEIPPEEFSAYLFCSH